MTNHIIGIDPGDSTGLAYFKNGVLVVATQGEPNKCMTMFELLIGRIAPEDRAVVAIERFISGRGRVTTHQPTAQQVIGVVDNLCTKHHLTCVKQGPSDAHAVATTDALKKWGLWKTGDDVGQRDANDANMAIRHALLTMAREFASDFMKYINA